MKGYEGGLALVRVSCRLRLPEDLRPRTTVRKGTLLSAPRDLSRDAKRSARGILRKEVIQPQVPLRLPCYDFTPVTEPTVVGCLRLRGWRTTFG